MFLSVYMCLPVCVHCAPLRLMFASNSQAGKQAAEAIDVSHFPRSLVVNRPQKCTCLRAIHRFGIWFHCVLAPVCHLWSVKSVLASVTSEKEQSSLIIRACVGSL